MGGHQVRGRQRPKWRVQRGGADESGLGCADQESVAPRRMGSAPLAALQKREPRPSLRGVNFVSHPAQLITKTYRVTHSSVALGAPRRENRRCRHPQRERDSGHSTEATRASENGTVIIPSAHSRGTRAGATVALRAFVRNSCGPLGYRQRSRASRRSPRRCLDPTAGEQCMYSHSWHGWAACPTGIFSANPHTAGRPAPSEAG